MLFLTNQIVQCRKIGLKIKGSKAQLMQTH